MRRAAHDHAEKLVAALRDQGFAAPKIVKAPRGVRVYMLAKEYVTVLDDGSLRDDAKVFQYDPSAHARFLRALHFYREAENELVGNPPRATAMFERFHGREPRKSGSFHADLVIPDEVVCVGDAVHVLYRSDKLNPETDEDEGWIDYIHDHEHGVKVYRCDREAIGSDAPIERVPAWLKNQRELTWLGKCLGFAYHDWGMQYVEAKGSGSLPELYTIPSGKALLVIQGKRRLLAMLWGGRLGVEQRGIVH